jgi:hypothetical protein
MMNADIMDMQIQSANQTHLKGGISSTNAIGGSAE